MKQFKYNALTAMILLSFGANAALVRSDIDYQIYRDFSENKGQFTVGARDITIKTKDGKKEDVMFKNAPVLDLGVVDRNLTVATLVDDQYVVSVKHNSGYGSISYGSTKDKNDYTYQLVDRNENSNMDYHNPRLNKLVTEVAPIAMGDQNVNYANNSRYSYFIRVGTGTQGIRDEKGAVNKVYGAYGYRIGGLPLSIKNQGGQTLGVQSSLYADKLGLLATYGTPGDSGSPIFAYDNIGHKWIFVGTLMSYTGFNGNANYYAVAQKDFLNSLKDEDEKTINLKGLVYFSDDGSQGNLIQRNNKETINLANSQLKKDDTSKSKPSLNYGQTIYFKNNINLVLKNDIDQGAGALYFQDNATVKGENNSITWLGAGISVADGKTVKWAVNNPEGDRLSKIGKGTLLINGIGVNKGDISVGDGTVIFNQQYENGSNEKQAFNKVGIVSGRSTVVLGDRKQVNPNKIYFGKNGGRLDVNGNDLTFETIHNVDNGAMIVNHYQAKNTPIVDEKQEITIGKWGVKGDNYTIYEYINPYQNHRTDYFLLKENGNVKHYFPINATSDSVWEFVGSDKNKAITLLKERNQYLPKDIANINITGERKYTVDDIEWMKWNTRSNKNDLALYEYKHNGKLSYFVLTGSHSSYFPTNQKSNVNWEYLGSNKNKAIEIVLERKNNQSLYSAFSGYFGEKEGNGLINSKMNVNFKPTASNKMLLLDGGANLNGDFTVDNGSLVFSGTPTPHAYDKLNNKEVVLEDDWISRDFKANNFVAKGNGVLSVTKGVELLQGNLVGQDNGKIDLGFKKNATYCERSDYTGKTTCNTEGNLNTNYISTVQAIGNIELKNKAILNVGKAHLTGKINADKDTTINVGKDARITMVGSGKAGYVKLDDGVIDISNGKGFNHFTIDTALTGNGLFNFYTNVASGKNDKLIVNGVAVGNFLVNIENSGKEPNVIQSASLIDLNNQNQTKDTVLFSLINKYANLGAYRYVLKNDNNHYVLYNPIKKIKQNAGNVVINEKEKIQKTTQYNNFLAQNKTYEDSKSSQASRIIVLKDLINQWDTYYDNKINNIKNMPHYNSMKYYWQRTINQYKKDKANKRAEFTKIINSINQNISNLNSKIKVNQAEIEKLNIYLTNLSKTYTQADVLQSCIADGYRQSDCEALMSKETGTVNNSIAKVAKISSDTNASETTDEQVIGTISNAARGEEILTQEKNRAVETNVSKKNIAINTTTDESSSEIVLNIANLDQILTQEQLSLANAESITQNEWISDLSNNALSSAMGTINLVSQLDRNVNRIGDENVWVNYDNLNVKHISDNYRGFKQKSNLEQIGVQSDAKKFNIGLILTKAQSSNDFEMGSGKTKLDTATVFLKSKFDNHVFNLTDFTYGRNQNKIGDLSYHRHLAMIGTKFGYDLNIDDLHIKPTAGVKYYSISKANYVLDEADVKADRLSYWKYEVGVSIDKDFTINESAKVAPFISINYNHVLGSCDKSIHINNEALNLTLDKELYYDVGVRINYNKFSFETTIGQIKGNEIKHQQYVSAKLGYNF